MATKADFNAEEWQTVVEGPAIGGLIVISSQRGGTIRETVAMAKAYAEAKREHEGHDLLGDVAAAPPRISPKEFSSVEDLHTSGIERVRNAVSILEAKASPEEVEAYRSFAMAVADRAAEADKSGGFLGVGGERVSDAERQAIGQLAEALGTEPPPTTS
jgi:hypothetical protein